MLDGLRVLDFSRMIAGPYCTLLLADLGADVVTLRVTLGLAVPVFRSARRRSRRVPSVGEVPEGA